MSSRSTDANAKASLWNAKSCANAVADAPKRVTVNPVVSDTPDSTVFWNALPDP
jgi:hypothetical protein